MVQPKTTDRFLSCPSTTRQEIDQSAAQTAQPFVRLSHVDHSNPHGPAPLLPADVHHACSLHPLSPPRISLVPIIPRQSVRPTTSVHQILSGLASSYTRPLDTVVTLLCAQSDTSTRSRWPCRWLRAESWMHKDRIQGCLDARIGTDVGKSSGSLASPTAATGSDMIHPVAPSLEWTRISCNH